MFQSISYEQWVAVTNEPIFLIMSGIFFLVPFIFYLILGATVKGKSSSGKTMSNVMLSFPNFYYALVIFDLIGISLYLILIVFPLWLRIF